MHKLNESKKAKTSGAGALLGIAAVLFVMASLVKKLSKIPIENMDSVIAGLTAIIVAIGAMVLIMENAFSSSKLTKPKINNIKTVLLSMTGAMLMMAIVMKIAGSLDANAWVAGIGMMSLFTLFVTALLAVSKIAKGNALENVGKTVLSLTFSMLLMILVMKIASRMTPGEWMAGIAMMSLVTIFVAAVVAVGTIANDKQLAKVGGTILALTFSMLLMTVVMKMLGEMDWGAWAKGILGVGALGIFVVVLMAAVSAIEKDAPKIGRAILALALSIGILGLTVKLLGEMDIDALIQGGIAVALLAFIMSKLQAAAQGMDKAGVGLIQMAASIGILALAVGLLSIIKPEKLSYATFAVGILIATFALLAKASQGVQGSMKSIITIGVIIAVLAGVVALLTLLPVKEVLATAGALSFLMISMAVMLTAISKFGGLNRQALTGMLGMVAIIGMVYLVVGALYLMQGIENAATNAIVLGTFMGVLSLVLILSAAAGAIYAATGSVAMLGLVGMVALIGMVYLVIGALALMDNVKNAITNLEALTKFMTTMTIILVALAIVGPLALTGVTAMAALTGFMLAMGVLATAIGFLMSKFPDLQAFLNAGLPVLILLAGGIGQMIGAFVNGILTTVAAGLPVIGMMLSQFMVNALPFITLAKMVNEDTLKGVAVMSAAVLLLTGADLIAGIASFLSGGSSFAALGLELSQFMLNAVPFITLSKMLKPEAVTSIKNLAQAITIITGNSLLDGITRFVTGESSLSTFNTGIVELGKGLRGFITSIGSISSDQLASANNAAQIIKTLAQAAKEIPNTGGLLGSLVGENDMGAWATQLPILASGIAGFTNIITQNKLEDNAIKTANTAAEVITTLAKAAKEIPNTGGLLADLIGDNDLATFASQLPLVGTGIGMFIQTLKLAGVNEEEAKTANTAAGIIKTLAKASQEIPNMGGKLQELIGEKSLSTFASELPKVGTGIAGYANKIGTFKDGKLASVKASTEALKQIVQLGKLDLDKFSKSMEKVGPNLETFAGKMINFVDKFCAYPRASFEAAQTNFNDVLDMIKTAGKTDLEGLDEFGKKLSTAGNFAVNQFLDAFKSNWKRIELKNGVVALTDTVESALSDEQFLADVKTAGMNFTSGFASGIRYNTYLATSAGSSIAQAALDAAMKKLDEHSPSKEAMKVGNYFGEGLVIGIKDYESESYKSGYSIADQAKKGLSKAISRVSSIINSDMDTQPTIRPVLDLSDVENGANRIGSLFNNGPTVGLMTNLNAISAGMNGNRQNGGNDDVVSAINKLGKNLGNIGGDTYNVNATASDDNGIKDAVQAIIRAAKIERRS